MCLGAFLAGEGIDLTGSLSFASPVYRLEIDFVGRLFAQDAGLYAEIMLASPERKAAAGRLAETFAELAELVRRGDRDGLVALFERVRSALGAETSRALAESSRIIEAFGTMLAAHEARQAIAGGDAARQQRSDAGHVALRRGATNGG
jgi:prephenate dehydrogenase/chorismate mutase/prephenate dehydrogenase